MLRNRRFSILILFLLLSAPTWARGNPKCEVIVEPKQISWEERQKHVYAKVFNTRLIIPGGFMAVGDSFGLIYFINYEHEYPYEGSIQIGDFDSENTLKEVFDYLESKGIEACRLRGLGQDDLYVATEYRKDEVTGLVFYSARIFNEREHILVTADTQNFWKEVMSGLLVEGD